MHSRNRTVHGTLLMVACLAGCPQPDSGDDDDTVTTDPISSSSSPSLGTSSNPHGSTSGLVSGGSSSSAHPSSSGASTSVMSSSHVTASSGSTSGLPRLTGGNLVYQGAFRLPADTFGASELSYSEGPLAYNPDHHSIYIVGHTYQQAIAEFDVPTLVNSTVLSELSMAGNPRQVFSSVIDRVGGGNPQDLDRIGGMMYVPTTGDPELLVNVWEYYDAPADNTSTTLAVRNANAIASSTVDGFYALAGRAHASGWMSSIPAEWQAALGGTHITGFSSGEPIISRLSVGPSAFVFDPFDIVGTTSVPNPVPTTPLLDFSLEHPLHDDLMNDARNNQIWTHLSRAVYGVIIPGTRTYLTVGHTGGHASGVCYKCTPTGATEDCGGYCARNNTDYQFHYWLWDVQDLVAVKLGSMNPFDVRPYEHGNLAVPFTSRRLGGGSFDPATGLLYITVQGADREQGDYVNPPVVAVYRVSVN